MSRPNRAATLSVLCQLYVEWEATTPAEEAVEDCLRRLVDREILDLYPHAFAADEKPPSQPRSEIARDSWKLN